MIGRLRARLRDMFAPPGEPDPDELVQLTTAGPGEALAEMWKGMLESAGIPCVLRSNFRYGYLQLSPVRLYVRYRDIDRARAVLAEVDVTGEGEPSA